MNSKPTTTEAEIQDPNFDAPMVRGDEDLIGETTDVKRGWPICRCGCKARTQNKSSVYLPGHDARHAGQVARAAAAVIVADENLLDEGRLAFSKDEHGHLLDGLSHALKDKAAAHAQRILDKRNVKMGKAIAKSEKMAVAKVQTKGSVKIGRWTYPVRNAAGLAQRNTKRDGSGEWVAVEPSQVIKYN